MKFRVFTVPFALLASMVLTFTACTKEGPVGPAGATGPAGPAGPTGPTGPTGPAGTANVFYSEWSDVTFAPQIQNGDTTAFVAEIAAPRLVDTVLARGDVKVYVNLGTAAEPTVVPLPLDAFVFQDVVTPIFELGKITLLASSDWSTVTEDNETFLQYRYIIIPGGTIASAQGAAGRSGQVNWNNYAEVKTYLGLKN